MTLGRTKAGWTLFSPFVGTRRLSTANAPDVRGYRMCLLNVDSALMNWSAGTVVTVKF